MRLVENKLELRWNKYEFMRTTVRNLGYEISGQSIRADDAGLTYIPFAISLASLHILGDRILLLLGL